MKLPSTVMRRLSSPPSLDHQLSRHILVWALRFKFRKLEERDIVAHFGAAIFTNLLELRKWQAAKGKLGEIVNLTLRE